jgi:hypothetical protein
MVDDPFAPPAPPDPHEVSGPIEGINVSKKEPAVKGKHHAFGARAVLATGNKVSHFESHCVSNGTQ